MNKGKRYSPEVRERAVRLLFEDEKEYESRWAATVSIASKIGCTFSAPIADLSAN